MQQLASWRRKQGWRQVDLAKKVGVDVSTVKRWERGETSPYSYHMDRLRLLGFETTVPPSDESSPSAPPTEPLRSAPPILAEKIEHPSTYFVQDRSNQEELDRLAVQDQMMTTAMGGVLSGVGDISPFRRILDVGCGTGGWLIETAHLYPAISQLVGVDVSNSMIEYARARAKEQPDAHRLQFLVMDALRMLEFPSDFFDLVNMRLGLSFLRTWDWPKLLHEFQRVTRTGGILRITETTLESKCYSPALARLQGLMIQALRQAGHIFEDGIVVGIPRVLRQYGLEQVQVRRHDVEYRAGTLEGELCIEDFTRLFRTALPFLRKWVQVPDNYEELYQDMLQEIHQTNFVVQWPLVTVWGMVH